MSSFIKLTTYKQVNDFEQRNSLLLKGQFTDFPTIVSKDDILQVLPKAPGQVVGNSQIIFKGGVGALPFKETFEEIEKILLTPVP